MGHATLLLLPYSHVLFLVLESAEKQNAPFWHARSGDVDQTLDATFVCCLYETVDYRRAITEYSIYQTRISGKFNRLSCLQRVLVQGP